MSAATATHRPARRALLSNTAGTGLSQLGSSASNILLMLAVSRHGSAAAIGEVAVALAGYQLALGATRALVGEVVLVRRELLGRLAATSAVAASVVVGVAAGGLLALAGAVLGLDAVWVLGAFVPVLAAQDTLRYISFTTGLSWRAACADLLWAASAAVLAFGSHRGDLDARTAALWWAVCGAVTIVVFAPRARALWPFEPLQPLPWIGRSWSISRAYLPDFVITILSSILPTFFVAAAGGLADAGALRLALAFFGPVTIAWAALVNSATPELARRRPANVTTETVLAAATAAAVLTWGVIGYVVPEHLGTTIAGDGWAAARDWLPWATLALLAISGSGGAVLGLRARGRAVPAMRARLAVAPLLLVLPCLGYLWHDETGYGIGAAIAGVVLTVVMWTILLGSFDWSASR